MLACNTFVVMNAAQTKMRRGLSGAPLRQAINLRFADLLLALAILLFVHRRDEGMRGHSVGLPVKRLISVECRSGKCADLGHLTASREVHRRWVTRLETEFFAQGDREREALLPISPLMDRTKEGVTKSQPGVRKGVE